MLEPEYLEALPNALIALYSQAETDILCDMARRINAYDYWIPAAEHQRKKLLEMGMVHENILKALSGITGRSDKELKRLMEEAGIRAIQSDYEIYGKAGIETSPLQASPELISVLNSGYRTTKQTFKNLTGTTANTATKQFEDALDRAWMQIQTGGFDYNAAIRNAVKDLSRQGVAVIKYHSGHKDTLEVAVRRAVVTGVNKSCADMQLAKAEELGWDLVEVSAHAGARPDHAVWQGGIYSLSGTHPKYPPFRETTGYGTGAGLCGWNCRHNFRPYLEGAPLTYSESILKDYEEEKYFYNGKRMTEYEATQIQRKIERTIRRWKREEAAMKAAGLDSGEAAARVTEWNRRQRDFLEQTGLKADGMRVAVGKNSYTPMEKRDIITLTAENEDVLKEKEFSELSSYVGKLSDRAVRKWYIYHDEQIPGLIDKTKSIEAQAQQACALRNQNRTNARNLMRNQEERQKLDLTDPNKSFEELLEHKMAKKGLSREDAINDILATATKTRKSVNKMLGMEE